MKNRRLWPLITVVVVFLALAGPLAAQSRGLKAISAGDMKTWLEFLAAEEFRGRSAPSAEIDIASRYIALEAERIGLKPLLPDGSFLQKLPVEVTTISPAKSCLRLAGGGSEQRFFFPQAFLPRTAGEWAAAGGVVFAGLAFSRPGAKWDDSAGIDLRGKFLVVLEMPRPAGEDSRTALLSTQAERAKVLREGGAIGLVTIIGKAREDNLAQKGLGFDVTERLRFLDVETVNSRPVPAKPPAAATPSLPGMSPQPFYLVDVRHEVGAALLGVSRAELDRLFESVSQGQTVAPKAIEGKTLDVAVLTDVKKTTTPNVVAYLPGSDARLKSQYVVLGSHHDHHPNREGLVLPGADDDGSGVVGMLSLAKALMAERPKRSVVFVWHTAEERGLVGAYYFVQHAPVSAESISANLNLDMISRNDPNMIYLIGSNKLSSELDKSIQTMNAGSVKLKLDYTYEDPGHRDRFFFRSDQYPYIRYGIPGVWFFCGTTPDYHTENDREERVDYGKMERVTKLVYLVTLDVGNKPALLKLDLHPEVTTRGAHNMKVVWPRPPQPANKR
jgi:hypothetical protein